MYDLLHRPCFHHDPDGHPGDAPVGRVITRRQALRLFGAAPLLLGMAGCTANGMDNDGPLTGSCVVRPQLTEGPFYVDAGLLRADIREDREGVPLALAFNVSRVEDGSCVALPDAVVDVWHADASGDYSGVGSLRGATFLRGTQTTDAQGDAAFTTIYPGWYRGRTPHVHFKVRSSAGSSSTYAFTSQLFFDDDLSEAVYAKNAPYTARGTQDTSNARDGIYTADMLMAVEETGDGYRAAFDVALYVD